MARDNLYSKTVVWVKITLPLVAIALLSSLFLLSSAPDPDAALPYAEVDINQVTREQRVSQPRFAGIIGEGQEIVLTADAVSAEASQTDAIHAQAIEGRVELSGEDYLTIEAAFGDIDMTAQMATFRENVVLQSSMGYLIESEVMVMALDALNMRSPVPIHVIGPGLDVTADTMHIAGPEGATIVRFNGSVRVLYDPES